jgi:hypothetical protein
MFVSYTHVIVVFKKRVLKNVGDERGLGKTLGVLPVLQEQMSMETYCRGSRTLW